MIFKQTDNMQLLLKKCFTILYLMLTLLTIVGFFTFCKFVVFDDHNKTPVLSNSHNARKTTQSDSYSILTKLQLATTTRKISNSFKKGITVDFLSNRTKVCQADKSLLFAILVYSSIRNSERRKIIRETWVNKFTYRNITLTTVFLIGKTNNVTEKEALENEHNTQQDIIQGDFMDTDSYSLLQKGVMGYKWVSDNCGYADLVIMARDYMFVNIYEYIVHIFEKYNTKRRHIFCDVVDIGQPEPLSQQQPSYGDEKNGILRTGFPSRFCKNSVVILTSDIVFEFVDAAEHTPVLHGPDEYLYGVLPSVVQDVTFVDLKQNITLDEKECLRKYQMTLPTYILACKADKLSFMYRIWRNSLKSVPKDKRTLFSNPFHSKIYNFARNYPTMKDYIFEKVSSNVTKG